ncbi:sentrin-specific protease 1-like [Olea europaea subsp. europaea]|uniref:Sentrin-specific protease 1-like n=1 Tax=Olea europaea subsp. europaea TaxID=158383 RepID=A0A8S0QER9_OLEEU|nr:sentrin-specific protease 1-like [Olea europaea subsp. europaea]
MGKLKGEMKVKNMVETPNRRNKRKPKDGSKNTPSKRNKSHGSSKKQSAKIFNCMDLRLRIDSSLPQQKNGHDCSIFTITYAEYLLHDDKDSMPKKFDAGRTRLDTAFWLYKHQGYSNLQIQGSIQRESGLLLSED